MESSKTYQYRKVMKPLLERQRRARINKYLDQLKDLMVDCLKQDNEHIIRLEKADILEYTVQYLRKTKEQRSAAGTNEIESFRNGYVHAANEVSRVLAATRGIDITLGTHLMTHIGHKLNHIQNPDQICQPLVIETASSASSSSAFSPASSGYHSDSSSMMASPHQNMNNSCWRPW